jgi:hypothetical protein
MNELINQITLIPEEELEEVFNFYLEKDETLILSRLLALREIPDSIIEEGFRKLFFLSNKKHVDYSKMSILISKINLNNYSNDNIITFVNQMYLYYQEIFEKNQTFFFGERNFWDIICLLYYFKDFNSLKIRYLSEIMAYSYSRMVKVNPQKILNDVNKILKFSKYY